MAFENQILIAISIFTTLVVLQTGEVAAPATTVTNNITDIFHEWMGTHNRTYVGAEKQKRFVIFKANYEDIQNFNDEVPGGKFTLGLNYFSDMTSEEFVDSYTCSDQMDAANISGSLASFDEDDYDDIGDRQLIDWRDRGAVTSVKWQVGCGCCWAMATTAAVEALHTKNDSNQLVDLSVQQFLECDRFKNNGCKGGTIRHALEYAMQNLGLTSEKIYPYTGYDSMPCDRVKENTIIARVTDYITVPANNERAMAKALQLQPIISSIRAGQKFAYYQDGIFGYNMSDKIVCGDPENGQNHAVLIVGMGITEDDNQTEYWILKNSHGRFWGEDGYMKIIRNYHKAEGMCGIARNVYFPVN